METIIFYSYKGGTGRSLATANMSVCLSRMGKNVALIDLDFDAPGLHFKFGEKWNIAAEKGGVLEYIFKHVEKAKEKAEDKTKPALAADIDIEPINDWVTEIETKKPHDKMGKIYLICAGNVYSEDYWKHLMKSEWYQMFSFAAMEKETSMRNAAFFVQMKRKIAELKPKPDFLLVDCRSGISEFEAFALRLWADKLALFFNNNEETIQCLEQVITNFQQIMTDSKKKLNLIPVLSRVPIGPLGATIKKEIRDRLFRKVERVPICMLHSDRNLELKEELKIALEGETPNTRIAHEYVELCAYIISSPNYNSKNIEETKAKIQKAICLAKSEKTEDRVFDLKRITGQLLNPHDGSPNVSFKISTFVQMMTELHNKACRIVYETGKSTDESKEDVERMFQEGGFVCGENFGTDLLNEWNKEVKEGKVSVNLLDPDAKIRKWCEFDSDVGFGRFQYVPAKSVTEENDVVSLYNNFLSMKQVESGPNLCLLMAGYIEGVLRRLLADTSIRVSHPSKLCERINQKRKCCDFLIHKTIRS